MVESSPRGEFLSGHHFDFEKGANESSRFDTESLPHWKRCSTKSKLEWLESAMRFGKLKKF